MHYRMREIIAQGKAECVIDVDGSLYYMYKISVNDKLVYECPIFGTTTTATLRSGISATFQRGDASSLV